MPTLVSDPGFSIDVDTLRVLRTSVGSVVEDLANKSCDELGIEDPTSIDTSIVIELTEELAGPAGKALRSVDLAWRLAFAIAELDEEDLPTYGTVHFDEWVPVETAGLLIVDVDVGSLRAQLKARKSTLKRAYTVLNVIAILSTLSGVNLQEAISPSAVRADGAPCHVQIGGEFSESVPELLQREFPGLPPNCIVTVKITTPQGAHVIARIQNNAMQG